MCVCGKCSYDKRDTFNTVLCIDFLMCYFNQEHLFISKRE